jgi:hypothetical protein
MVSKQPGNYRLQIRGQWAANILSSLSELGSLRLQFGPCPLEHDVAWTTCSPAAFGTIRMIYTTDEVHLSKRSNYAEPRHHSPWRYTYIQ